jgi:hypothetical protein
MSLLLRKSASVLLLLFAITAPAAAQCTTPNECILPPGGCVYVGPNTVFYPGGYSHSGLIFDGVMTCDPFPGLGGTFDSFFDVFFEIQLDTGMGPQSHQGQTPMGVRIQGTGGGGNQRFFETEIISMNLTGGNLPPLVKVRESQALSSRGQLTSTDLGGGVHHIDSFFDVFTELSLDGGQTWLPGNGSSRLQIVPNSPTPAPPATWGSVKAFYR